MKQQLLILLFTSLVVNIYGKDVFKQGYFINNNNKKTICQIQVFKKQNRPNNLNYKLNGETEIRTVTIKTIKEFAVPGSFKYIRKTIQIDKSNEALNNLNGEERSILIEGSVFLEVLIEGKANLYLHEQKKLKRFFYSKENGDAKQLLSNKILKDYNFRTQLSDDLKCNGVSIDEVKKLPYRKSDLSYIFIKYNKCQYSDFISYEENNNETKVLKPLHLTLKPRIIYSSFEIDNQMRSFWNSYLVDTEFKGIGFGFGTDLELILPIEEYQFTIFSELAYLNFKGENIIDEENVTGGKIIVTTNYNSLEIPFGIRYYQPLNRKTNLFFNVAYVFGTNIIEASPVNYKRIDNSSIGDVSILNQNNIALGGGIKYKQKYSIEFRYQTNKEIVDQSRFTSQYSNVSFILGYTLF